MKKLSKQKDSLIPTMTDFAVVETSTQVLSNLPMVPFPAPQLHPP